MGTEQRKTCPAGRTALSGSRARAEHAARCKEQRSDDDDDDERRTRMRKTNDESLVQGELGIGRRRRRELDSNPSGSDRIGAEPETTAVDSGRSCSEERPRLRRCP